MEAGVAERAVGGAPPARTREQREAALKRANEVRIVRANWKRDVRKLSDRESTGAVARLLLDGPTPMFETMTVFDALMVPRGMGTVKVSRILRSVKCSPTKTLAGLSNRQRIEIAAALYRRVAPQAVGEAQTRAAVAQGQIALG